jgi:hypothetical protein
VKPFLTHCTDLVLGLPLGVSLLVSCSQHYLGILSLFLNHILLLINSSLNLSLIFTFLIVWSLVFPYVNIEVTPNFIILSIYF